MDTTPDPATATTPDPSTDKARPLARLTDDELDDRLAGLAGRLAAVEADFLAHVVELDLREMWARYGLRSSAHYLSWRLGLTLGAARERVRVARTLLLLPKVAAALAEGQLSYCKVRALSRVATPVTEDELLEVARSCTGAQLERVVRSWRQALTAEDSASATLRRKLTRRVEPDGSVTFTIRGPTRRGSGGRRGSRPGRPRRARRRGATDRGRRGDRVRLRPAPALAADAATALGRRTPSPRVADRPVAGQRHARGQPTLRRRHICRDSAHLA
jgi:hypothetical protein